jgi:hypothetical protein
MDAQAADFGRASRITSRAGGPEPISIGRPGSSAQLVGWREHPRSSPKYQPDRWNRTATWDSHQPRWYLGESQLVPSVTRGRGHRGRPPAEPAHRLRWWIGETRPRGGRSRVSATSVGPRSYGQAEQHRTSRGGDRPHHARSMCPAGRRCARLQRVASHVLSEKLGGDPDFAIERAQEALEVHHAGLHLDHDERGSVWMPRQHIDGASLAVPVERPLHHDGPAAVAELADHDLDDRRVTGVEQPIQLGTPPARCERQIDAKHSADPAQRREVHLVEAAALDHRHRLLRDAGPCRDLPLAEPLTPTNGAVDGSDLDVLHPNEDAGPRSSRDQSGIGWNSTRARAAAETRASRIAPPSMAISAASPPETTTS